MTNNTQVSVVVKFSLPGFHFWPEPPKRYAYLGNSHRHIFYFEIELYESSSRDIEIIEFKDFMVSVLELRYREEMYESLHHHLNFGPMSCENIAYEISKMLEEYEYNTKSITVLEDNENGARICCQPN